MQGAGLTNQEYAPLAEIMGRVHWAPEVFNCSAPDTGNMETIARYGNEEHRQQWLQPLLAGKIRSAFAMTEPEWPRATRPTSPRASSARATSTSSTAASVDLRRGRRAIYILMGKTDPEAPRHPAEHGPGAANTPGVKVLRALNVLGYDDAPGHMEVEFKNVRVPASNILLGEGRGFEIAQGRLARVASTTACA